MRNLIKSTLLLCILVSFTSCASIIHGSKQVVPINSTPAGATVMLDGLNVGETPVSVEMTRKDVHTVTLQLDGYQDFEMRLARKTSGWVWGNIVFGGIIGLVIDASTGAMYKVHPEIINADLETGSAKISETKDGIVIVLNPQSYSDLVHIGNLTKR